MSGPLDDQCGCRRGMGHRMDNCHSYGLCGPDPAAPVVQPADQPAPDTTAGDALRDDAWWTRLFLAVTAAVESVPYAAGPEYPAPHAAAFRSAVEPALAQLLADAADGRELRAKVQRVRALHNDTALRGICAECSDDVAVGWPCATIDALEGTA